MAMQSSECFEDNIKRLDPSTDPLNWNLNNGLLLLAKEVQRLQQDVEHIRQFLETAPMR